ncbi:MAG: hypothetical protein J5510_03180 [Prevotella sp.]|nr:hypothetical protein [Prevotella sp.]
MKKRFYTIGSLICAGIITTLGFGSCKSGKALQQERARLNMQADSLQRRIGDLEMELNETKNRIKSLSEEQHITKYGGPIMTERERREMENMMEAKDKATEEAIQAQQKHFRELDRELNETHGKFNEVLSKINSK